MTKVEENPKEFFLKEYEVVCGIIDDKVRVIDTLTLKYLHKYVKAYKQGLYKFDQLDNYTFDAIHCLCKKDWAKYDEKDELIELLKNTKPIKPMFCSENEIDEFITKYSVLNTLLPDYKNNEIKAVKLAVNKIFEEIKEGIQKRGIYDLYLLHKRIIHSIDSKEPPERMMKLIDIMNK